MRNSGLVSSSYPLNDVIGLLTERIRLLLVEDNPIDVEMLREDLTEVENVTFDIQHFDRLRDGIQALEDNDFDVMLLDLGLPDSQGLESFIQAHAKAKNVPIVVLSGLDDETLGIEAVRSGAQDYLVKGKSDKYALTRSLTHAVQRHQLLMELEISKEKLEALYKWIPLPTFTWEREGDDFILVDKNIAAQQERNHKMEIGVKASEILKTYPDLLNTFFTCFREKKPIRTTQEFSFKGQATSRYYEFTHVFVPPNRIMAHVEDLTARRKAELALKQSEERFRAIFEGAQDCIFLKDKSFRYTHVNPAMARLYEVPADKFIGKTDEELFQHNASAYIQEVDRRVLKGELIEEEHTRKVNGMPITFNEMRVPMRNSNGELIGLCGIARNMTERKSMQHIVSPTVDEYPSQAMKLTLNKIRMCAQREATILLLGESGSGKDYLAKYIHDHSKRVDGPFYSINCAAVARELAESELFGHERGAFTGAHGRKRGLLELAEGGTLLLNEIGELSVPLQAKLLTFLDTREFTRVGGEKKIVVNARLIAATNRDLEKEVQQGRFRQDLFYRLNVMTIDIPPLRERREDIPLIINDIVGKLKAEMQLPDLPEIDSSILNTLINYDWPGNVRELRNVLERAIMLSGGSGIYLTSLGITTSERDWSYTINFPAERSLNDVTRELKSSLVNEALRRSGGSRQGAAKLLGISRYSLKHYMNSLDLDGDGDSDENE